MWLGIQSEETLLRMRKQSLSRGSSQSAVRSRSLSLCIVWPSHSQGPSEQICETASMRLPILQLSCKLLLAKHRISQVCQHPYSQTLAPCDFWFLPKTKMSVKIEICECDDHTAHNLSQRRLTADWLAPRKCACSQMRNKVSSDWLPSYIKATWPVLEIFKLAGYFPDRRRMHWHLCTWLRKSSGTIRYPKAEFRKVPLFFMVEYKYTRLMCLFVYSRMCVLQFW